mmetsp:Transcript_29178/g.81614  ORF Transcript_29178/g.81614 Transcript_29178/m.81614 type:complete len:410 (+) Transcript_29178:60-1289(+)
MAGRKRRAEKQLTKDTYEKQLEVKEGDGRTGMQRASKAELERRKKLVVKKRKPVEGGGAKEVSLTFDVPKETTTNIFAEASWGSAGVETDRSANGSAVDATAAAAAAAAAAGGQAALATTPAGTTSQLTATGGKNGTDEDAAKKSPAKAAAKEGAKPAVSTVFPAAPLSNPFGKPSGEACSFSFGTSAKGSSSVSGSGGSSVDAAGVKAGFAFGSSPASSTQLSFTSFPKSDAFAFSAPPAKVDPEKQIYEHFAQLSAEKQAVVLAELEKRRKQAPLSKEELPTGEEGEKNLFQQRGKLFELTSVPASDEKGEPVKKWKERGVGPVRLNVEADDPGKSRIVMRMEGSGALLLNVRIFSKLHAEMMGEKSIVIVALGSDGTQTYRLRMGQKADAQDLHQKITEQKAVASN